MAHTSRNRRIAAIAGLGILAVLVSVERATPDDRDLLRFNTAKPYVFIVLDNSGSMNLDPVGNWVSANADDPRSKLRQAKEALYEVFNGETDFHVGFATYNQDRLRVKAKHWIYTMDSSNSLVALAYPTTGEELTFGAHLETATPGVAGNCGSPLPLGTSRDRISRFPKLGATSLESTITWISHGGRTYRLTNTIQSGLIGQASLGVTFQLERVSSCSPLAFDQTEAKNITLKLQTQFLMRDLVATTTPVTQETQGPNAAVEPEAGFWQARDAFADATCNTGGPFSGDGWEGNYDSGVVTGDASFDAEVTNVDPFAANGDPLLSRNLLYPTSVSPLAREIDLGDMVPFHWSQNNVETMLRRLAPNHNDGSGTPPEFRAAPYFEDTPDPLTGHLELKNTSRKPIVAAGDYSPLGDAIADFRCWYLGQGANKCRDFGAPEGWQNVAVAHDTEWGCRRPYLIVVGDGGDNCPGENPCADTANLWAKAGIRSWVITYAQTANPPLHCIAQNGRGELVFVNSKQQLIDELQTILGLIREESRAFASAAAPSVQAVVEDKVYVSTFVPLNNSSYWDGHLDSFLKPLPLDLAGRPDRTQEQFNWDAGQKLVEQAPTQSAADTGDLKLGEQATSRRVFYTRMTQTNGTTVAPGQWAKARRLFDWTEDATDPNIRYDLWRGFAIPFVVDDSSGTVDQTAQDRANQVIADALAIKQHTLDDGTDIEFVLGDVFHSDPLIVGSPANFRLFAENSGDDGTSCESGNPSYRCFFRKHQFRRKMVIVGSNDGMFHFIDGGTADKTVESGETVIAFNNGTGHEIASYIPRPVMPTVRQLAEGTSHRFGADGTPVAADVFIDPVHDGTPDEDEREFRTVLIAGLREGGSGYLALDITQPDTLDNDQVPEPINDYVPSCLGTPIETDSTVSSDCGPVPFPSPLWEFNDSVYDDTPSPAEWVALDEDGNGLADLGDTWSPPAIGRIRVCEDSACDPADPDNDVRDMWVAVFGGGMDAANKDYHPSAGAGDSVRGDWIYMVDIETGQVIYKRAVDGSLPAGVAAVDTDQDGYLDRMYAATLAGFLYRVDLTLDGTNAPSLVGQQVTGINGITYTVPRIPLVDGGGDPYWEPRKLFDANFDGSTALANPPRSLYHEPSVVFVANLGLYALAFGTGDREDLWSGGGQAGRFYVFVDDTDFLASAALPLDESAFTAVGVSDADVGSNFLTGRPVGQRGWYLPLDADEKVITRAFALSGVTFFTAFQPDVEVSEGRDPLCSKTGNSRIFIVNTTNANAFITDLDSMRTRFKTVSTFVTPPYTEQGSGRNIDGGGDGGGEEGGSTADDLTEQLQDIMDEMKKLFPAECRFANYRIDIKTIASDTGVIFIAPVPVCLMEKNWKEF